MKCEVWNERETHLDDVDPLIMSDEEKGAHDDVSSNIIGVEITWERDEISAMDVWQDYSIDMRTEEH